MRYLMREAVGAVLNEGSDLEDFSASGSEENIVDSGKEFVPVDLEVDSSDSDNDIFIFVIGIHATSRIKRCCFFHWVWMVPALLLQQRKVCGMTMNYLSDKYIILSFQKMYMFIVLFIVVYLLQFVFIRAKTMHLQEPRVSFCGILNELITY